MGVAAYNRGSLVLTRRFQESAEVEKRIDDTLGAMAAADRAVEYCRDLNSKLAVIATAKGIRYAYQQAAFHSHIGQVRYGKYLSAAEEWRYAKPGRPTAFSALRMKKAAKSLAEWIEC